MTVAAFINKHQYFLIDGGDFLLYLNEGHLKVYLKTRLVLELIELG
jgi:hypothetical protein